MGSPISDDGYGTGPSSEEEEGERNSSHRVIEIFLSSGLIGTHIWMLLHPAIIGRRSLAPGATRLPPPSSNLSWADFSEPGQLGVGMMQGVVNGVVPNGMELFFKSQVESHFFDRPL